MPPASLLVLVEATPTSLKPLIVESAAVIFPSPGDFVVFAQHTPLPMGAQLVPCLKKRDLLGFLKRAKEAGAIRVRVAGPTPDEGEIDAQIAKLSAGAPPAPAPAPAATPPPAPVAAPMPVAVATAALPSEEATKLLVEGNEQIERLTSGDPKLAAAGLARLRAIFTVLNEGIEKGARESFLTARARLAAEIVRLVERRAAPALLDLLGESKDPDVVECLARHLDVKEESSASWCVTSRPALRAIYGFGKAALPGLLRHAAVEDSLPIVEVLADALITAAGRTGSAGAVQDAALRETDPQRRERLWRLLHGMRAVQGN